MKKIILIATILSVIIFFPIHGINVDKNHIQGMPTDSLPDANLFQVDDSLLNAVYPEASSRIDNRTQLEESFTHAVKLNITSYSASDSIILILVSKYLYDNLEKEIVRYAEDIHAIYGCGIIIEEVVNASCEDLKSLIVHSQDPLCGCIFIGNLAEAFFESQNDYGRYGYRKWPCDLFFMDIDGIWIDSDSNGIYDRHTGDVEPEIFFGRLSASGMTELDSEINLIKKQLNKSHEFWWKSSYHSADIALNYIDKDWKNFFPSSQLEYTVLTNQVEEVRWGTDSLFSPTNYLSKLSRHDIGFIQLASHSSPTYHAFSNGYVYTTDLHYNISSCYCLNLFCCSACNWLSGNAEGYLGGSYLFNDGKTLAVIGSTKIGSTRDPKYLLLNLQNKSIGAALLKWWKLYNGPTHTDEEISWSYGMTILGDPTISLNHKVSNICKKNLALSSFPSDNASNLLMFKAAKEITISDDFIIPASVHIIFDAPSITFTSGFCCPVGASFETRNEGCEL